jgi:RimJ/RimL family protein N-acetyltransferase
MSTDRLTLRAFVRADITALTRYRNLDDVARFQDWPLPYTRDLAHQLVDEMDELAGPTPDHWYQIAIDDGTGLVGDAAVWLGEHARTAMLGYTLAPAAQGRGYAVEVVTALADCLLDHYGVRRVAATLDPRNLASARVLERCGFVYEGTARSSVFARGEWSDDATFALLGDDRDQWRSRPTGRPSSVRLTEIDEHNVRAVGRVDRAFSQRGLVSPVLISLAEALVPPTRNDEPISPWYRAIEADDELAGFVMVAEPGRAFPDPYLWRLVVDSRHQGRGVGKVVVRQIADEWRRRGCARLLVSYVPDVVGSPARFYEQLGFVLTGREHDGEVDAALDLV